MNLKEKDLYPMVCKWLEKKLAIKFKRAKILVFDTSDIMLSKFLYEHGYHRFFKLYETFEFKVDVTGIIIRRKNADLVLIECKLGKINLRDLSQLLGYSKVAKPLISIILSPKGVSDPLYKLFNVFRRYDVLYYDDDRHIFIGTWNIRRAELDPSSIIPRGKTIM